MRFIYRYRDNGNVCREGTLSAADRESAYAQLRAKGVRPFAVVPAPGILNRFAGIGKRGWAIIVLVLVSMALVVAVSRPAPIDDSPVDRQQVYGDPDFLRQCAQAGWTNVFANAADAFLACHAQPGYACFCHRLGDSDRAAIAAALAEPAGDLIMKPPLRDEVAKMFRIVRGMRHEFADYRAAGGSALNYMARLDERQGTEAIIFANVQRELNALVAQTNKLPRTELERVWTEKNEFLREMGLKTVAMPIELDELRR